MRAAASPSLGNTQQQTKTIRYMHFTTYELDHNQSQICPLAFQTMDVGLPVFSALFEPDESIVSKSKLSHTIAQALTQFPPKRCCKKGCYAAARANRDLIGQIQRWRVVFRGLRRTARRAALMRYIRARSDDAFTGSQSTRPHELLGFKCCGRAFRRLGVVSASMYASAAIANRSGLTMPIATKKKRSAFVADRMHGALMVLIDSLNETMPTHRPNASRTLVPFRRKLRLFRLLQVASEAADPTLPTVTLAARPAYGTFCRVMQRPDLKAVQFHRTTELGRCGRCQECQYKMVAAPTLEERSHWDRKYSQHQWLQMQQRRMYSVDRLKAAHDFLLAKFTSGLMEERAMT